MEALCIKIHLLAECFCVIFLTALGQLQCLLVWEWGAGTKGNCSSYVKRQEITWGKFTDNMFFIYFSCSLHHASWLKQHSYIWAPFRLTNLGNKFEVASAKCTDLAHFVWKFRVFVCQGRFVPWDRCLSWLGWRRMSALASATCHHLLQCRPAFNVCHEEQANTLSFFLLGCFS